MDKLEVYSALSGADYIKDKLLSLLTLGPTQEKLDAYAIKCRIKKRESLTEKISLKKKSNPTYSANSATDIVGLRLISLHSDNLMNMTRVFLDFVRLCQNSGILLFSGGCLKDCIREIIVYKTVNNDTLFYDAIYSEVKMLFKSSESGVYDTVVKTKTANKEQPYSSVHIVCDAVSHIGSETKIIPIEVQIRTVLEDYWAEIDHPIRYKGPDYQQKIDDEGLRKSDRQQYLSLKEDLRTFKTLLDSATAQADGFKTRYEIIEKKLTPKRSNRRRFTGPAYRFSTASTLLKAELETVVFEEIQNIEDELDQSYVEMSDLTESKKARKEFERLGKIATRIDALTGEKFVNIKKDFDFYKKMEMAACFIWRFKLSTAFGLNWYIQSNDIDTAIRLFKDLLNTNEYSENPIIPHKLGFAAFRKGQFYQIAIELIHNAILLYDQEPNIDVDPFLKIEARKDLAFIYWDLYQFNKENANHFALQNESQNFEKKLIEDSLALMEEVIKLEKKASVFQNENHKMMEVRKSANNYISYIWEYYQITGKRYKTKKFVNKISTNLEESFKKNEKNVILFIDSLAKGFYLSDDFDKAVNYAQKSLYALEDSKLDSLTISRIREGMDEIIKSMEN